jgi:hypothetical protein
VPRIIDSDKTFGWKNHPLAIIGAAGWVLLLLYLARSTNFACRFIGASLVVALVSLVFRLGPKGALNCLFKQSHDYDPEGSSSEAHTVRAYVAVICSVFAWGVLLYSWGILFWGFMLALGVIAALPFLSNELTAGRTSGLFHIVGGCIALLEILAALGYFVLRLYAMYG